MTANPPIWVILTLLGQTNEWAEVTDRSHISPDLFTPGDLNLTACWIGLVHAEILWVVMHTAIEGKELMSHEKIETESIKIAAKLEGVNPGSAGILPAFETK